MAIDLDDEFAVMADALRDTFDRLGLTIDEEAVVRALKVRGIFPAPRHQVRLFDEREHAVIGLQNRAQ